MRAKNEYELKEEFCKEEGGNTTTTASTTVSLFLPKIARCSSFPPLLQNEQFSIYNPQFKPGLWGDDASIFRLLYGKQTLVHSQFYCTYVLRTYSFETAPSPIHPHTTVLLYQVHF